MIALIATWLLGKGVPSWLIKPLAVIVALAAIALGFRIWLARKLAEERNKAIAAEQERQRHAWSESVRRSNDAAARVDDLSDADIRRELHERARAAAAKSGGDPV